MKGPTAKAEDLRRSKFPNRVTNFAHRSGVLVGGLGISGDGVDQNDFVAAGGSAGFEAPTAIRAYQVTVRAVRLPYLKFRQNPGNSR